MLPRPRPSLLAPARDDGVSVVIGTILLIGLVTTTLVTIQVHYVPGWERNAEAQELRTLREQFAALRSVLDDQLDNRSAFPRASPFALTAQRDGAFVTAPAGAHALAFEAGSNPVTLQAPKLWIEVRNRSEEAAGIQETWGSFSGASVSDIGPLHSLRLRIDEVGDDHEDDYVNITMRNATGALAGSVNFTGIKDGSDHWTKVRTTCGPASCTSAAVLLDQRHYFHAKEEVEDFIIDVLDPALRFSKVAAAASWPQSISVARAGFTGEYAIGYTPFSSLVNGTAPDPGIALQEVPAYAATWDGGSLVLRNVPHRLDAQTYVLENGAFVWAQADGQAFRMAPEFAVNVSNNVTYLELGIPSLVGDSGSVAAGGAATVYTSATGHATVAGHAARLWLNVTTDYPGLWTALWDDRLAEAGLALGTHYVLSSSPTRASLEVRGLQSAPASEERDIRVAVRRAVIDIDL